MDKFECMKSFILVAKNRSFTIAARKQGVGLAKVSKQINFLEEWLSSSLFIRTTRKVELTAKGEVFLNYAEDIIKRLEDAQNDIENSDIQPRGEIAVSITAGLNVTFFIEHFANFLSKYDQVKLNIHNINSPLTVLEGTCDVSISSIDVSDPRLVKYIFCSFKRKLYASPKYLEKRGVPSCLADLSKHNTLVNTLTHPKGWQFGKSSVNLNYNYLSSSTDELKNAAIHGLGIIWSIDPLVRQEVSSGQLVEIQIDEAQEDVNLYCYFLQTSKQDKRRILAEYLFENVTIL
ncbi:LysR family transcriptional regulator [Francisella tularensis]|uniref:Transcriptional regulator, LysR family n=4 Tax=Francisella tularensis TaxID=263 RepID=Q5NEI2_FRATT|nr:LysR family transcriptional regulator [Francisella tularensis]ABO47607.1 Transcriptional regulator, LysR family [Francisella tularensis subsp. tularensis WY96-3418]ADA79302.1 Transcriptional regulator, LysR family protein [Francisella tularensis subsp. tularensis NE061598]AFB79647.1 Transcriptional regulator LysR family [Francisella tularensis subsp. tularensis TIGB03]AFB81191.1 Transcriptional regulator LysR family [Francisella tularensis subsp. tularensis TI0902]AJI68791.1 bacterial regul